MRELPKAKLWRRRRTYDLLKVENQDVWRGVMDKTMMFVQRENISQTLAFLQKEESPSERSLLKRILVEEETKYGFYSEQLDMADRHIRDAQSRIAGLDYLIRKSKTNGMNTTTAQELLSVMEDILEMFISFRAKVSREVEQRQI